MHRMFCENFVSRVTLATWPHLGFCSPPPSFPKIMAALLVSVAIFTSEAYQTMASLL